MILKEDRRPHFLINDCVWTLVHLHYTSQFHTFQGNHQCLQWNDRVYWFQWLEWHYCGLVTFFRINNIELKCSFVPVPKISQVMMKWCRRALHLGRFTLWNNGRRATQLGRFTSWHYGRIATQLSRFALWHNGRRAKQPGLMHAPGVARILQRKIWRHNPKQILLRV